MAKAKEPNAELVRFVKKANDLHLTYGQLQVQETIERQREVREAAKRIARRKGGGKRGCKKVSSAGE